MHNGMAACSISKIWTGSFRSYHSSKGIRTFSVWKKPRYPPLRCSIFRWWTPMETKTYGRHTTMLPNRLPFCFCVSLREPGTKGPNEPTRLLASGLFPALRLTGSKYERVKSFVAILRGRWEKGKKKPWTLFTLTQNTSAHCSSFPRALWATKPGPGSRFRPVTSAWLRASTEGRASGNSQFCTHLREYEGRLKRNTQFIENIGCGSVSVTPATTLFINVQ